MANAEILIVDDNPVNLKLAHLLLTGEGHDVRTANDAEEALERPASPSTPTRMPPPRSSA